MAFLGIIAVGFLAGLFVSDVSWVSVGQGLRPAFDGTPSVLLATSMLGATVMPHAIYLHSALTRDRTARDRRDLPRLLRATRWDVVVSMSLAGAVNLSMLVLAAANLQGVGGTDTIEGAHWAIEQSLGPVIGGFFAVGLLASGLASTSVGSYAGATIMAGLLHVKIPMVARRAITLIPALILLATGIDPTWALVLSQVFLSLGIPFALAPLVRLSSDPGVLGQHANAPLLTWTAWVVVSLIVLLNLALVVLMVGGVT